MPILGPNGKPLPSSFKKAPPPAMGEIGGLWAGHNHNYARLPGGAMLQFDLSKLQLSDYRSMRDHYQVNANLVVLQFMMHRLDWRIKSKNKKVADEIDGQIRKVWTRLIRGVSQAYWAGYSPNVLEFENDVPTGRTVLNKVKDLPPEDCAVNWKFVDGWAPPGAHVKPKIPVFDGIRQLGMGWPYPNDNSFWYTLLMENGDHYGKKLLRPAFPSWFFSIILHLFANRYYERFGEPVPIGRAPFDDELTVPDGNGGQSTISGREAMSQVLTSIRNRAVVVLPSDRTQVTPTHSEYDYTLEYLESQMRGADFERYMTRLDEEISLSLFTPILLLRTADVGSYNLGVGHMQMYMWMLNALAGDLKEYIDRYIVNPIKNFNFGPNADDAEWEFIPLGKTDVETVRALLTSLTSAGKLKPDYEELGDIVGMSLKEVKESVAPAADPTADPTDPNADPANPTKPATGPGSDTRVRVKPKASGPRGVGKPRATEKKIVARIASQVSKAYSAEDIASLQPTMGYAKQFAEALREEGFDSPEHLQRVVYDRMENILGDLMAVSNTLTAEEFTSRFATMFDYEIEGLLEWYA